MQTIHTYVSAHSIDTGSDYLQDLSSRDFTFKSDAFASSGGKDLAPTPSEYLVAALAGCTSMTIKMYLNVKKWSIESLSVEVKHQKTDDKQMWIERTVKITGALSQEQKQRVLDIANKCPVHKIMEKGIEIRTVLE